MGSGVSSDAVVFIGEAAYTDAPNNYKRCFSWSNDVLQLRTR